MSLEDDGPAIVFAWHVQHKGDEFVNLIVVDADDVYEDLLCDAAEFNEEDGMMVTPEIFYEPLVDYLKRNLI